MDKRKEYDAAVKTYLAGLEYLVPMLTCRSSVCGCSKKLQTKNSWKYCFFSSDEQDESKKKLLKEKVQGHMARTEELKRLIKKPTSVTVASSNNDLMEFIDESQTDYLKRIFADQAVVIAALESGCTAEYMVDFQFLFF